MLSEKEAAPGLAPVAKAHGRLAPGANGSRSAGNLPRPGFTQCESVAGLAHHLLQCLQLQYPMPAGDPVVANWTVPRKLLP